MLTTDDLNKVLKGRVEILHFDKDGKLCADSQHVDNLIVQVGHNFVANALVANSTSPFTYIAVGTGTNPAASGDTTLQTEVVRQVFSSHSVSANVVSLSVSYGVGVAAGAITEAGIFNASSSGTMLSHVVFSVINVGAQDTLLINWTITA